MYGRYRHRRSYGRYRRRYYRRRVAKRSYRRYRRGTGKTKSAVVKLTLETDWTLATIVNGQPAKYNAFSFSPILLPGFTDYQTVYQKFRIMMAKIEIATPYTSSGDATSPYNYLIVGSRPFAETNVAVTNPTERTLYLPAQQEADLRQTRWQKVKYPSAITRKVSTKFKPYTLVAGFGPNAGTASAVWQRPWEGGKWTPFTWANAESNNALIYYGPYCVISSNLAPDPTSAQIFAAKVTLTCWFRFSGQK